MSSHMCTISSPLCVSYHLLMCAISSNFVCFILYLCVPTLLSIGVLHFPYLFFYVCLIIPVCVPYISLMCALSFPYVFPLLPFVCHIPLCVYLIPPLICASLFHLCALSFRMFTLSFRNACPILAFSMCAFSSSHVCHIFPLCVPCPPVMCAISYPPMCALSPSHVF